MPSVSIIKIATKTLYYVLGRSTMDPCKMLQDCYCESQKCNGRLIPIKDYLSHKCWDAHMKTIDPQFPQAPDEPGPEQRESRPPHAAPPPPQRPPQSTNTDSHAKDIYLELQKLDQQLDEHIANVAKIKRDKLADEIASAERWLVDLQNKLLTSQTCGDARTAELKAAMTKRIAVELRSVRSWIHERDEGRVFVGETRNTIDTG
jgi:hypothetical protein